MSIKAYGAEIFIPQIIQQRITRGDRVLDYSAAGHRTMLWGIVKLARSTVIPERTLFRSSGPGRRFILVPSPRSSVPLQHIHIGHGTISNEWADISRENLDVEGLLRRLNEALGTQHTLGTPGLRDCLNDVSRKSRDFGEAYGFLRPRWSHNYHHVFDRMGALERALQSMRGEVLRSTYIHDCRSPPRRVWDLRSNRVLPFHSLTRKLGENLRDIPLNVWSVSHSWVDDAELQYVWTNINGMQWPVPIPRHTSLDHVRVELLNMGAEYVWLDVLCLRQQWPEDMAKEDAEGSKANEVARQEEWKVDVPTIGYVYDSIRRPCIVYFNGLGMPLDTSRDTTESPRHWFSRSWTMQECVSAWLPGGLTGDPVPGGQALFTRVEAVLRSLSDTNERVLLIDDIRDRYVSKTLDRISGLGYLLKCGTLPIYQVQKEYSVEDLEAAWGLLIKHMHPRPRTLIFLLQASDTPFSPWISWERFAAIDPWSSHPSSDRGEDLMLVDAAKLETMDAGEYYHAGYALRSCRVRGVNIRHRRSSAEQDIDLLFEHQRHPTRVKMTARYGIILPILPDMTYTLVGVGVPWKEHWVVIEEVGEREVAGRLAVEAVKWAVIRLDRDSARRVEELGIGHPGIPVVYLSSADAQRRSKHLKKYLSAFNQH